ncbi:hypothetical protein F4604DRAFT_1936096 [Suillus subluteus]|nr:hypothetical protein F4604DRAFT_1936096 [Suillus subluteus]
MSELSEQLRVSLRPLAIALAIAMVVDEVDSEMEVAKHIFHMSSKDVTPELLLSLNLDTLLTEPLQETTPLLRRILLSAMQTMLSQSDYWFHHFNLCDEYTPAPGDFLELPAGSSFTVEVAANRGVTSLSFNGQFATEWGNGGKHPEDYSITNFGGAPLSCGGCIGDPNKPVYDWWDCTQSLPIEQSDISHVTMDNLAVFTVRYNTSRKRVTSYDVPKDMPACLADGCTCAIMGLGSLSRLRFITVNEQYLVDPEWRFKCMVTSATSTTPVATPKPPVWCEEDQSTCTQGAKQILIWNQAEGNDIAVNGTDLSSNPKSPAYNGKCGFQDGDGAQNDIFGTSSSAATAPAAIVSSSSPPASSPSPPASSFSPPVTSLSSAVASHSPPVSSPITSSSAAASMTPAPSCEISTSTVFITSTVPWLPPPPHQVIAQLHNRPTIWWSLLHQAHRVSPRQILVPAANGWFTSPSIVGFFSSS